MAASKDHVRELYYLKRNKIPEHTRIEMDNSICNLFFSEMDISQLKVVHTYLPIEQKIEVDTFPIIERLASQFPGIRIAVPYTIMADRSLKHRYWKPGEILVENKWGIPEPDPITSEQADINDIDLVLVPLMAFDLKGHRVGYGAGFYDRFLAECKPQTLIVGLSHFAPEDQWIQNEEYDIDLDFCITSEKVYKFK